MSARANISEHCQDPAWGCHSLPACCTCLCDKCREPEKAAAGVSDQCSRCGGIESPTCCAEMLASRRVRPLTLADLQFTSHDDKRQPRGARTILIATHDGATFAASYCTNRRKAEHSILQAFIDAGHRGG